MKIEEAAATMNGGQYGAEGSREFFAGMKAYGLVAVFGASDDLMEFRGAIDDELGAYEGTTAYLTRDGLLTNGCGNGACPYFEKLTQRVATVEALWDDGGFSWRYKTEIPHATFVINEDDEPYCEGIVFDLSAVPE